MYMTLYINIFNRYIVKKKQTILENMNKAFCFKFIDNISNTHKILFKSKQLFLFQTYSQVILRLDLLIYLCPSRRHYMTVKINYNHFYHITLLRYII